MKQVKLTDKQHELLVSLLEIALEEAADLNEKYEEIDDLLSAVEQETA